MNRPLKTSVVRIFLAVLVIGLALFARWILSLSSLSLIPFDFLTGRAVTASLEYDPRKSPLPLTCASGRRIYHSWIRYYSFQADFRDVCKAADTELLALGFRVRTYSAEGCRHRIYTINEAALRETVAIIEGQRFVGPQNGQLHQSSIAEACKRERRDGWVTVRIERDRLPLWPPRYLLYRLKSRLQAASQQMFN
jgi:hypothetical protein